MREGESGGGDYQGAYSKGFQLSQTASRSTSPGEGSTNVSPPARGAKRENYHADKPVHRDPFGGSAQAQAASGDTHSHMTAADYKRESDSASAAIASKYGTSSKSAPSDSGAAQRSAKAAEYARDPDVIAMKAAMVRRNTPGYRASTASEAMQ